LSAISRNVPSSGTAIQNSIVSPAVVMSHAALGGNSMWFFKRPDAKKHVCVGSACLE
jgi:hypothetical protein